MAQETFTMQLLEFFHADAWTKDGHFSWLTDNRIAGSVDILIGACIVYFIGVFVIKRIFRHVIRSTAKHRAWHKIDIKKREQTIIQLALSVWRIAVLAYIVGALLHVIFKVDLSPLFASAGIIGVAIGFGAQSLIKDFLSGVFIIAENQYRVGDIVDLQGATGTVERIGTRTTVLRDADGNVHYLPNGTIMHVVNKTMGYGISRFSVSLTTDSDIKQASDIINETGATLATEEAWKDKIIDPPKFISVGEISGKSVELIITGKTQPSDQWSVTAEMRKRLLRAFRKHDIDLVP